MECEREAQGDPMTSPRMAAVEEKIGYALSERL
jgi:hypothetical protein